MMFNIDLIHDSRNINMIKQIIIFLKNKSEHNFTCKHTYNDYKWFWSNLLMIVLIRDWRSIKD